MKYQSKYLAVLACCLLASAAHAQQQCSELFFVDKTDNNKVIDIIAIDGELVKQAHNYNDEEARKVTKGVLPYHLAPGNYSLTLRVWDEHLFSSVNTKSLGNQLDKAIYLAYLQNLSGETIKQSNAFEKNAKRLKDHYEEKTIQVSLLNGQQYNFGLTSQNDSDTNIVLINAVPQYCNTEDTLLAKNKEYTKISALLPDKLEQNLQSIMSKLNSYHAQNNTAKANLVSKKVYEYFGTVLDTSKSEKNGYKVLVVLPYSLAHKLALESGDVITEFAGKSVSGDHKEANQELVKYISTVPYGRTIEFTVLRNNEKLTLSHRYTTSIIPESSYAFALNNEADQVTIINSVQLPEGLAFQYEHLMMELTSYFKSKGIKKDIELYRPLTTRRNLGLTGSLENTIDGVVLVVTHITANSAASRLGVQVNDRIHAINGQDINSNDKLFESITSALVNNEQHSMIITRDNKKIRLEQKIKYEETPAFSLKVAITMEGEFLKRPYRSRLSGRNVISNLNGNQNRRFDHDNNSRASQDISRGSSSGTTSTETSGN
jgi:C-terminal processing protease CtpA/Prc